VGIVAPQPASPTVRRKQLANTLRRLRAKSRLTLEDAAAHLEMSAATLSRIENGRLIPRARDVRDLVRHYGLTDDDEVAQVVALVAEAKEPGWWEAYSEVDDEYGAYIGFESSARVIEEFQGSIVPALLQSPDYTRAYLEAVSPSRDKPFSAHDVMKLIEIRVRRQRVLESTLQYSAIIDEGAVLRRVGGSAVMWRQLSRLVELAGQPNISLRLLPLSVGAHPGQRGNFTILTLPQEAVPDMVYLEFSAGEIFMDADADVKRYRRTWQVLENVCLDEKSSLEALRDKVSDLTGPAHGLEA
jgi:transcriptional regulator with XRE-family HTH domain